MNRELDGVYFRVERDGKWQNICFTDLTEEEIETVVGERSIEWWKSLALILKGVINDIGEQFDIKCSRDDEEDDSDE